jgi:hypothetical protein
LRLPSTMYSHPPQLVEDVTVSVQRYAVFVGPSSQGSPRRIVVVHGSPKTNDCGSFFTALSRGGTVKVDGVPGVGSTATPLLPVVVTVATTTSVLHPVWHVEHGPKIVLVGVVSQHGSLGGTKEVVVDMTIQSGAAPPGHL